MTYTTELLSSLLGDKRVTLEQKALISKELIKRKRQESYIVAKKQAIKSDLQRNNYMIAGLVIVFFIIIFSFFLYAKQAHALTNSASICTSDKCTTRFRYIEEAKTKHKSKEAIVDYVLIRTIFNKKKPVSVSEFRQIEKEINNLYEIVNTQDVVDHNWFASDDIRQTYIDKMYTEAKKQWLDHKQILNMLGTFLWENGKMDYKLRSYIIWANGYYDYWLCQINKGYHPKIVNDKRFFTDVDFQISSCVTLYKWGTKFYGAKHKEKMKKFITTKN